MEISRLTSTVTKTRRLYYLYEISKYLQDRGVANYKSISNHIIASSNNNHKYLKKYKDPTGEINTDYALKRYLDLSSEVGLVKKMQNRYENTIEGDCLSYLITKNKPYKISKQLQIYFLRLLLEKDFDYTVTLFKLSYTNKINHINFRTDIEKILLNEPIFLTNIDILNEIKTWKNPVRYFRENIFAPRRSWFIDLDLITTRRSKNSSTFILKGDRRLFNRIIELDKNKLYEYLDNNYYTDCSLFFYYDENLKYLKEFTEDEKYETIYRLLDEIFTKYGYADRISSKFFFNFGLIIMLCDKKIVAERNDVEKVLNKISKESIYRYRPVTEKKSTGELIDTGYITKSL